MKKIKILKSFPTTHYGQLLAGNEIELPDHFADDVVKRMKAGEYIKAPKAKTLKLKK